MQQAAVGVKFHANYILTMPNFHIENNSLDPSPTHHHHRRCHCLHTALYIQIKMRCEIPKWAKGNRKKAVRKFIYYSHERYFFLLVPVLVRLRRWSMTKKRTEKEKKHSIFLVFFSNFLFHSFLRIFGPSCNAIGRVLN